MILFLINLIMSFIFIFLNHPMSMGFSLLMQTIVIALITGLLNMNFWFSYILFLIMIGGMLVLFIYMTSIASNEMFSFSKKITILILSMTTFFCSMYIIIDSYFMEMMHMHTENYYMNYINFSLIKYFNYPSMFMIFFMIIYLFITLIAVVKITKIEYGPLRQKF